MIGTNWKLPSALVAICLSMVGTGSAKADFYVDAPPGTCYYPPPAVSYYAPAPQVSYYYAPAVSYYPPAVSYYYAPPVYYAPPSTVTTTRYGLFGRPWVSTTRYYSPVFYGP